MAKGIKDNITQKEKEKIAYDYYTSVGWTPAQISGIVGNQVFESAGYNEKVYGDSGAAYGISQWHKPRQDQFKKLYGKDIRESTFQEQLVFTNWELNNSHKKAGDTLRTVDSPMSAGQVISDAYEAPKVKYYQNKERQLAVAKAHRDNVDNTYTTKYVDVTQQQEVPIGDIYNTQVAPYMNQVQNVSNLPLMEETTILAEETDDNQEYSTEVENAKARLAQKQQREINEQRFLEQVLKASQVEYIDPNQSTDYTQQEEFQNGGEVVKDDMGYWNPENRGRVVEIGSNRITMKGVNEALWAVPDVGEPRMIFPNQEYIFPKASKVTEYPLKNKRFR